MLPRFMPVNGGRAFVPVEEVIAANLDELFEGMEILEHALFRVTRDADFTVGDEADDLLQAVETELRRRRFGEVVRLEVQAGMDDAIRTQLVEALGVEEGDVFEVDGPDGRSATCGASTASAGFSELRDPPWQPVTQPRLTPEEDARARRDGRDAPRRHPRPPPVRLLHHLRAAADRAGRRGRQGARDQADRVPDAATTRRSCRR